MLFENSEVPLRFQYFWLPYAKTVYRVETQPHQGCPGMTNPGIGSWIQKDPG